MYIAYAAFISILCQELIFDRKIVINDLMIIPMICKYIIIYIFARNVIRQNGYKFVLAYFVFFCSISSIVALMQYYNIFKINEWFTPFYLDISRMTGLLLHTKAARVVGTIGSPQKFGQLLVLGIIVSFYFIFEKRRTAIYIVYLMIMFLALIYTLSRMAVIASSISFIGTLGAMLYFSTKPQMVLKYLFVFISVGLIVYIYFASTKAFEARVLDQESDSFEVSEDARLRDAKVPFYEIAKEPIIFFIGKGPSKDYLRTSMHNDFSWMLERFGILALIGYLSLIFRSLNTSRLLYTNTRWRNPNNIYLMLLNIFVIWLVYCMGEDVFKVSKIMPLNLVFMGLLSSLYFFNEEAQKYIKPNEENTLKVITDAGKHTNRS